MTASNALQSIAFSANLQVTNVGYLVEEYAHDFDRVVPVPVALLHFSTQLAEKPEKSGIKIISQKLQKQSETTYQLTVEATIHDATLFRQSALDAVFENWGDTRSFVDAPESLLLAELVLCSNASVSPDQLGYAIVDVSDAKPMASKKPLVVDMEP